jgi:two-component system nitrogen regulation response regulator GlnG
MASTLDGRDPIAAPGTPPPPRGAGEVARRIGDLVPELADALLATGAPGVHREVLALVERNLIARALERTRGNQLRAARLLGINRNTLRKRCRLLGLPAAPPREVPAALG